jgi:hypothetical protein
VTVARNLSKLIGGPVAWIIAWGIENAGVRKGLSKILGIAKAVS